MMKIIFSKNAWEDYIYWQIRTLKFDLAGYWSRRIDLENRLVYQVNDSDILIYACGFHYDKK